MNKWLEGCLGSKLQKIQGYKGSQLFCGILGAPIGEKMGTVLRMLGLPLTLLCCPGAVSMPVIGQEPAYSRRRKGPQNGEVLVPGAPDASVWLGP